MHVVIFSLGLFLLACTVIAVRFLRQEAAKDRALLALFTPGNILTRSGHRYEVVELQAGCALMRSLDGGDARLVDLLTGAGTYRNGMTAYWSHAT